MWFKAVAALAVLLTLCAGLWFVKSRLDKLEATQARLAQVEQMLSQSRNELQAERLARKLDAQENTEQYEKVDWACVATVKQAVAGIRVKPVPVEQYVYVDREIATPQDCPSINLPHMFRLRDIQEAGTDPD